MIKTILIFMGLFIPIAVSAQLPKTVSQQTINATVERFAPAYCKDGLNGMAKALNQCFLRNISPQDRSIDQCMLGSLVMLKLLVYTHKISLEQVKYVLNNFQQNPMGLISDDTLPEKGPEIFLNFKSLFRIFTLSRLLPNYKNFKNGDAVTDYLSSGLKYSYVGISQHCQ